MLRNQTMSTIKIRNACFQLHGLIVRENVGILHFHSSAVLGIKQSELLNLRSGTPCYNIQLESAKIEKKKRKIKRELGRLERRVQRIPKPIEEKFIWLKMKREIKEGIRTRDKEIYSTEEKDSHALLLKEWSKYKKQLVDNENKVIERVTKCQERALRKLREESEELFIKAIQLDESLLGVELKGPVETPPRDNYDPQDGQYEDLTEYFKTEKVYEPDEKIAQAFKAAVKKQANQ